MIPFVSHDLTNLKHMTLIGEGFNYLRNIAVNTAGQHRCFALGEIMKLLGNKFTARISPSFTIGFFENMPKQISNFISKVSNRMYKTTTGFLVICGF